MELVSLPVDDNVGIRLGHESVGEEDLKLPAMATSEAVGEVAEELFIYNS